MGWMCSWVGVQGVERAQVLEALGFAETGQTVEPGCGASKWSVSEVDDGWLIVFSEDFDWGGPNRVRELSALGLAVGLQFEDKVEMTSIACAARDGVELWRVSHNDDGGEPLTVSGDLPAAFAAIRDEYEQMQVDADDDSVDYLHDIPIEVAKAACGYRADYWLPPFAAVRPVGASKEPERSAALAAGGFGGFLRGLFGSRR